MPELVEIAGGEPVLGATGTSAPRLELAELAAADPDVIVALPCGFDLTRTRAEMPALTGRPEWRDLRAVRSGQVYVADGNAYFNRPGPRLVDSAEILAAMLHPGKVEPVHAGTGWSSHPG